MKKILFLSLFFALSFQSFSQEVADYKAENEGWLVRMEEAYALSKKTGKPIMANFTGSDWCGWCKRLTASVFSQDDFKKWAADNVILLELDYPRRKTLPAEIKQQNAALQQAFGIRGFPTVWVFNLDRDETNGNFNIEGLGSTGYTRTVKEFTDNVDQMIARGK
ncbi:MAG: thioredoxin fold domain-containing protein [Bacteroidota bacterium]